MPEQWEGLPIDGLGTKTLGRIAGIHVDADDGPPRWALIRIGPLAGCTAIPYEHVAEGAGGSGPPTSVTGFARLPGSAQARL